MASSRTRSRASEGRPGPSLPAGQLTFVFTDIEGSTRLLDELGPRFDTVMLEHAEIIRAAATSQGGIEVNTEGDSFFLVFPSPAAAAAAVIDVQQALARHDWPRPLKVRVGMHTGEGRLVGRDYIGMDVNRASRIADAAHGGQILVSESTHDLLGQAADGAFELRALGVHRLKDVPEPERLYQLIVDGLPSAFPPPRTLELTPTNLPQQLTPFFGRQEELREAGELLATNRLVTLTGPGGSGKTRLALELARQSVAAFPDGIYFVPLAALREPELVVPAIAKAYELSEGEDLQGRLIERIGQKQQLLLLDNFEQLMEAADEVERVLSGTARLKILVTSRGHLGVYGEREYAVPPLVVPDPERLPSLDDLARFPAIALFVDRARAVRPDFELTDGNARSIALICRRLDGLPLAIELAAARVRLLPPDALLARLSDRLSVIDGRSGDRQQRQRTLYGTIRWSYELLSPDECAFFSRLGVFLGGASVQMIAQVLETHDELDLIDRLGSLIDKSLLRRVDDAVELRVDMLETIREFAVDRLEARGEAEKYRERHARAYAEFIEAAGPKLVGEEGGRWLDSVEQEHDNLRAALTWSAGSKRAEYGLRIVAACWRYWQMRGHVTEGRDRAEAVLAARSGEEDEGLIAAGLEAAGGLAYWQGEFASARQHYREWLELERKRSHSSGIAEALYNLSFTFFVSLEDPEAARGLAQEALGIYRELDDQPGIAKTLWALGGVELSSETMQTDRAREYFREARDLFSSLGNQPMLAWAYFMGGGVEIRAGDRGEARAWLRDALRLFVQLGDVSGYALAFRGLAVLEWADGQREAAARLAGASERLSTTSGVNLSSWTTQRWLTGFEPDMIKADASLVTAWSEGEDLETDAAVQLALSLCEEPR